VKYLAFIIACLLLTAWWPATVQATDPALDALQQNVAVAYQPPQASAEALLSLPSVYVLPGSFLYWFKHVVEEVRLLLAANPQQRSALLLEFSQQRLAEGYQAISQQNWPAARQALQEYQRQQDDLSKSLSALQQNNQNVDSLLDQLRSQLGVQQALDEFVSKNPQKEAKEIGALLKIRPQQTLALATAENGALLGAHDQKQSTSSAQASPSASPSASLTPTASSGQGAQP
jgi:hypothetical protein